jgi:hypothetical protein
MKHRLFVASAIALTSAVAVARAHSTSDPTVITQWSVAASTAATASGMAPLRAPITFAILHLAMYDAVNAIDGDHVPFAVRVRVKRPASAQAAAIEAGYRVLVAEFPTQLAALDTTRSALLNAVPDSPARASGLEVGAAVATRLLAARANDGRNAVVPYVPGSGPGVWIPTPPAFLPATSAFLARVTPFIMRTPWQFRPVGPPRLHSRQWAEDYNEVKALGAATGSTRTAAQTATALFWEPFAGTVWPATIRRLAAEQDLDLVASARFQAVTFAAFADGLIACWDAKFHFNSWRPVTAIPNGNTDGNRRTVADPSWMPLAVTPNFPEYPSGHACVTSAIAHTIENFFDFDVTIPARNIISGEERFYGKASQVADEVVEARMLLGVHFRSADEDGAEIGRKIARRIKWRWLR